MIHRNQSFSTLLAVLEREMTILETILPAGTAFFSKRKNKKTFYWFEWFEGTSLLTNFTKHISFKGLVINGVTITPEIMINQIKRANAGVSLIKGLITNVDPYNPLSRNDKYFKSIIGLGEKIFALYNYKKDKETTEKNKKIILATLEKRMKILGKIYPVGTELSFERSIRRFALKYITEGGGLCCELISFKPFTQGKHISRKESANKLAEEIKEANKGLNPMTQYLFIEEIYGVFGEVFDKEEKQIEYTSCLKFAEFLKTCPKEVILDLFSYKDLSPKDIVDFYYDNIKIEENPPVKPDAIKHPDCGHGKTYHNKLGNNFFYKDLCNLENYKSEPDIKRQETTLTKEEAIEKLKEITTDYDKLGIRMFKNEKRNEVIDNLIKEWGGKIKQLEENCGTFEVGNNDDIGTDDIMRHVIEGEIEILKKLTAILTLIKNLK